MAGRGPRLGAVASRPVKRSGPPERRARLTTDPAKVAAWQRRSRKPIRPKPLDSDERARRERVREQVYARDGWRCRLADVAGAGPCFGELTPHHRRKSGQGGGYTVENLAALCAGHNDRIEQDADLAALARSLGLVLLAEDV